MRDSNNNLCYKAKNTPTKDQTIDASTLQFTDRSKDYRLKTSLSQCSVVRVYQCLETTIFGQSGDQTLVRVKVENIWSFLVRVKCVKKFSDKYATSPTKTPPAQKFTFPSRKSTRRTGCPQKSDPYIYQLKETRIISFASYYPQLFSFFFKKKTIKFSDLSYQISYLQ